MISRRISTSIQSVIFALLCLSSIAFTQSSDQNFPTPLASNIASGTIKARDIGDSRLTTYYYAFNGGQGDIFINVTTKNFNGDIDVFAVEAMRPLTKILIFADSSVNETGRLIYLRKPERLLLRIQGRSPDDDPASFQIKFGGSFIALASKEIDEPEAPTLETDTSGSVRVNSVGTILEAPVRKNTVAKVDPKPNPISIESQVSAPAEPSKVKKTPSPRPAKIKVSVGDAVKPKPGKEVDPESKKAAAAKKTAPKKKEEPQPDPLANVRLIIAFKNGDSLERPLPEILKFSVDKGVLTVIAKDGSIRRYSMVDVTKVTIE